MKTVLTVLALSVLTACGGGGGGGGSSGGFPIMLPPVVAAPPVQPAPQEPAPKPPVNEKECTIVVYGDSIMRGQQINATTYATDPDHSPVVLMNRALPKMKFRDMSVPGRSLKDFMGVAYNEQRTEKYVVIEHGVIDSWYGLPIEQNYRDLITVLRAEGRTPIITGFSHQVPGFGVSYTSLMNRVMWNAKVKEIAAELKVPFADLDTVEFNGADDVPDTVHPGVTYSKRLVDRIVNKIGEVAPHCR